MRSNNARVERGVGCRARRVGLSVASALASVGAAQPALSIIGADGVDTPHSYATAVSADGRTVGGFAIQQVGIRAFRWDADSGLVLLNRATQDPGEQGTPFALSEDGTLVVGFRAIVGFPVGVVWDDAGAATELGTLGADPNTGLNYSAINACNNAGDTLVGITSGPDGQTAFRWTSAGGMVSLGGLGTGAVLRSEAFGVSSDGSTIIGDSLNDDGNARLFRWTEQGGMIELARGPFEELSVVDASPDASAMTGGARSDPQQIGVGFVWHEDTGVTELPLPNGATAAFGFGVSDDGTRVYGRYEPAPTAPGTAGFIWTPDLGIVDLNQYCIDTLGIDPGDWILYPEDTDARGGVIVGAARLHTGGSPFALAEAAFVLDLGLPCEADLNEDGSTNFFDLAEYIGLFNAGDARADLDQNGQLNFFDVFAFLGLFSDCQGG